MVVMFLVFCFKVVDSNNFFYKEDVERVKLYLDFIEFGVVVDNMVLGIKIKYLLFRFD